MFQGELLDPALKGTMNVLKSCVKSRTLKRVVLTSSIAAVAYNGKPQTPDVVVDETWFSDAEFCRRNGVCAVSSHELSLHVLKRVYIYIYMIKFCAFRTKKLFVSEAWGDAPVCYAWTAAENKVITTFNYRMFPSLLILWQNLKMKDRKGMFCIPTVKIFKLYLIRNKS